jgi:diazepam-binding inhibitor (GABA receptor modulator, acyl-CoA-binding protein)
MAADCRQALVTMQAPHVLGPLPMSSELQTAFDVAIAQSRQLPERPDNATLLKLYALYKQATDGEATGERPGVPDFVGRAKWDAWAGLNGLGSEAAKRAYIELVQSLAD